MKILDIYIDGFGALSDTYIDFNQGLNSFCERNGYGKTTISCFIRAMFYGLERANKKAFNDRAHFKPLSSSSFGGKIRILKNNSEYTIIRSFGFKSSSNDTLKIYDKHNSEINITESPGFYFLGLDQASFERTFFMTSLDFEYKNTDNILSKISKLNDGDSLGYNDVKLKLTDSMKRLKGGAKSRLKQNEKRIEELRGLIKNEESLLESRDEKNDIINGIYKENQILNQKKNTININDNIKDRWKSYDSMLEDIKILKNKKKELLANLNNTYAEEKDTIELNRLINEKEKLKKEYREEDNRLKELEEKYKEELNIEELESNIIRITNLKRDLNNDFNSKRFNDLKGKFYYGVNASSFDDTKKRIKELEEIQSKPQFEIRGFSLKIKVALWAISALVAIFSFIFIGKNIAIGIIGIVISLSLLLLSLLFRKKVGTNQGELIQKLKEELNEFFSGFRVSTKNYSSSLEALICDYEEYQSLKTSFEEYNKEKESKVSELNELTNKVNQVIIKCNKSIEDYHLSLYQIKAELKLLDTLKAAEVENKKNNTIIDNNIEKISKDIDAIKNKYKLYSDDIASYNFLYNSYLELNNLEDAIKEGITRADKYKLINNLDERPLLDENLDFEEIENKLNQNSSSEIGLLRDLDEIERALEEIDSYKNEIEELELDNKNTLKRYDELSILTDAIDKAQGNLHERYIKPSERFFIETLNEISPKLSKGLSLGLDYSLNSLDKSLNQMSEGELTSIYLALRMGVIKAIYGDVPFLILDDPFLHLDDSNFSNAKGVLNKISKTTQVIYFTCSTSRKM